MFNHGHVQQSKQLYEEFLQLWNLLEDAQKANVGLLHNQGHDVMYLTLLQENDTANTMNTLRMKLEID